PPPPEAAAEPGARFPARPQQAEPQSPAPGREHPVTGGSAGSAPSRNALAYAAGVSQRLGRPLLVVYVCSSGVYCEPLTGQVVGVPRDAEALERWLLAELDQITGPADVEEHGRTRRGSPGRERTAPAAEVRARAPRTRAPNHDR